MYNTSINEIMRDVVSAAGELWRQNYESGKGIAFLFGDWAYVADTLTKWNEDPTTLAQKFPCIVLYSPFTETRGGERIAARRRTASLDMLIMTNTLQQYSNETRENVSFAGILRPIYNCFLEAINRDKRIVKPYKGTMQHEYRENYRYGRSGVNGADGKTFFDYIDGIEINKLQVTIQDTCN